MSVGVHGRQVSAGARSRVAYLVISHVLPDQVARLVRALRRGSGEAAIAVHHDPRGADLDREALGSVGAVMVEPCRELDWGAFSHLDGLLACLAWMVERIEFDWLVLLSGQDYPIRPLRAIEADLARADVDAFIEARPCLIPGRGAPFDQFQSRYHYWWKRIPTDPNSRLIHTLARVPGVRVRTAHGHAWVGRRRFRSPFDGRLVCHVGADWFTLSHQAVGAVLQFARLAPIMRHYRHTLVPTESFFQTALANRGDIRRSGDYRRFTIWPDRASSPRVLTTADLPAILSSGHDFARKFDPRVDANVLDALDEATR